MAKRQTSFFEKAAGIFDLPAEAVAGLPRMTVTGAGRVHIENQKGLLSYGTEEITVNGGHMVIRLTGKELELAAMTDLELVVTGKVEKIEFLR